MRGVNTPALLGKLPSCEDFVRLGASDELSHTLESWLVESLEHAEGAVVTEPVRFMFMGAGYAIVGAHVPCRDRIGRVFPIAAFERIDAERAELGWATLPLLYASYLAEIEGLLTVCAHERPEALRVRLSALTTPHDSEFVAAEHQVRSFLRDVSPGAFAERALGAEDALAYALLVLREAASQPAVSLDVPVGSPEHIAVWLELAGAAAPDAAPRPSLVWTRERAFVSLGAPSSVLTQVLLGAPSARVWPMTSPRIHSHAAAAELTPALRHALASVLTLEELVATLRSAR